MNKARRKGSDKPDGNLSNRWTISKGGPITPESCSMCGIVGAAETSEEVTHRAQQRELEIERCCILAEK